ncbi:MAG: EAL domain-containing protein, partial [bacterium]
MFHRFVCYGLSLTAVGIFLWKMIAAPRLYLERYAVIFFSMVFICLWKTFYIFSRSPIDRSMVGFGFFGLLVYYFAICYRPVRLLDKMLARVASQVFQGVFFFDAGGACVWVNRAGREAFHIDHDNYEPSAEVLTGLFGDLSGEEWVRHDEIQLDGEKKYFALEKHSIRDSRGKTAGSFLSVLDETEQQAKMERDRYNATHDALTGLYSREYFYELVRETMDANPNTTFFICSVDIKDFKMVNDIFGREFGDYVLKCLADSIRTDTGEMSICGRLAGDTFGMCIPAWRFNADIARGIMENFVVRKADAEYRLVMHEGVYEAVEPELDVSVMFDRANMALESIKDQYNTHIAFYDDAMRQTVLWNQRISEELDAAIREGQVRPYLQAIVDQQGRAVGAEVLARWIHPTEGFLPPARFIPIFEKNGMTAQVDRYMWRCACEILAGWGDNGLFLSINVSPKDFYFMDVVGELIRLTEAYNIKASRLRVEITETLVMADEGKRIRALKDLRAAGFIVEMDDF